MQNRIDSIRNKLKIDSPDVSVSYINSTCPECFGWISILNSHKCSEGWNNTKHLTENEVINIMKEAYSSMEKFRSISSISCPKEFETLLNEHFDEVLA